MRLFVVRFSSRIVRQRAVKNFRRQLFIAREKSSREMEIPSRPCDFPNAACNLSSETDVMIVFTLRFSHANVCFAGTVLK